MSCMHSAFYLFSSDLLSFCSVIHPIANITLSYQCQFNICASISVNPCLKQQAHANLYLSIWLCWVWDVACGTLSCTMWGLVPGLEIEPRPSALEHVALATREVPISDILYPYSYFALVSSSNFCIHIHLLLDCLLSLEYRGVVCLIHCSSLLVPRTAHVHAQLCLTLSDL